MREIKFRAWWIKNEVMLHEPRVVIDWTIDVYEEWQDEEDGRSIVCELMQYTGLKDKNGVEIYEGDILQIYTRDNELSFKDEVRGLYDFFQRSYLDGWEEKPKHKYIEIIGNIYENPELLNR